ncbi:hypothetical protein F5880DRAFT_1505573 [Lentinula raphanica]|nr:hypothetical protein F5880DRAFT_1505573 [Lentinula raphanica]
MAILEMGLESSMVKEREEVQERGHSSEGFFGPNIRSNLGVIANSYLFQPLPHLRIPFKFKWILDCVARMSFGEIGSLEMTDSGPNRSHSNPSLDGAEPLTQSSQLMGQTLDVATPQRQDFGLHRDKDDDLTVDDLEHDLPVAISPSTSISVNLDHQADLSKRGDDKSKIPVREVYERLEADLKSIFTFEDQWSENEKLKDDFHHYHLGKVKLIEDWYPKLGEILDYATKVPQLQVSPDPEPDYIHGIFAEGHLQHKFLNNIAQWNRVSSKKLRTKLEYAAATFELIMGRATLFAMEEEKAEIETIRDRDPAQYHTKCEEFVEEYRPQVEDILKSKPILNLMDVFIHLLRS